MGLARASWSFVPLEEPVGGYDGAAGAERLPEGGLRRHRLGPSIEQPASRRGFLRPRGNQAPAEPVEDALSGPGRVGGGPRGDAGGQRSLEDTRQTLWFRIEGDPTAHDSPRVCVRTSGHTPG